MMDANGMRFRIALMGIAAVLVGCRFVRAQDPVDRSKPDAVAKAYFERLLDLKYAEAYKLIADTDRELATSEEFQKIAERDRGYGKVAFSRVEITQTQYTNKVRAQVYAEGVVDGKKKIGPWYPYELVKSEGGEWGVCLDDIYRKEISYIKNENLQHVVESFGSSWAKQDYKMMSSCLSAKLLSAEYGRPPYEEAMQAMCAAWTIKHGELRGISCTGEYVRYVSDSEATIPAKFAYSSSPKDKLSRFAAYLVRLERDPVSSQWKISELKQTPTYQRPPEVQVKIKKERLDAEQAATDKM